MKNYEGIIKVFKMLDEGKKVVFDRMTYLLGDDIKCIYKYEDGDILMKSSTCISTVKINLSRLKDIDINSVEEYVEYKPIYSILDLDQVRKELSDKYNTDRLYISNKSGKWEIIVKGANNCIGIFDGFDLFEYHDLICVDNIYYKVNKIGNKYHIAVGDSNNKGSLVFKNWKNKYTINPTKVVDLKEEGYEIVGDWNGK